MRITKLTKDFLDNYDLFLLDLWGVIHDGSNLYEGSYDFLNYLKSSGKNVIFISNLPRRSEYGKSVLDKMGVGRELYHDLISSGDIFYYSMKEEKLNLSGKKYFFIGNKKDLWVIENLGYEIISNIQDSDFILCHNYYDDEYTKLLTDNPNLSGGNNDILDDLLHLGADLNKPLLCVNPDINVIKQDGTIFYCAGHIADKYKDMAGQVHYFGKPYAHIYNYASKKFNILKDKIIAFGDSFYTDILGANNFGIDSVLVTEGIFKDRIGNAMQKELANENYKILIDKYKSVPNYIISNLMIG